MRTKIYATTSFMAIFAGVALPAAADADRARGDAVRSPGVSVVIQTVSGDCHNVTVSYVTDAAFYLSYPALDAFVGGGNPAVLAKRTCAVEVSIAPVGGGSYTITSVSSTVSEDIKAGVVGKFESKFGFSSSPGPAGTTTLTRHVVGASAGVAQVKNTGLAMVPGCNGSSAEVRKMVMASTVELTGAGSGVSRMGPHAENEASELMVGYQKVAC